ncbi:MAG: A/G-specific adenine glycosylase [Bacteroidetes bacterium]|nr:MAG: A/G-specific adenine glycosylase [Bacteroidota bacterium]PIE88201.1 MAG: A/G-specific adenine glycosylase [Bacteroidota bacterium]
MKTGTLITWYEKEKRSLPWREKTDPYAIWISEIMLQQTRVDQVIGYYLRFMEHFPSIAELARASEDQVLKLWQGLGYYSRARNIHKTAKILHFERKDRFPSQRMELVKLPGIGDYTSGAIASIAFDEKVPAIDGNVQRVIARFQGVSLPINTTEGAKKVKEYVEAILPDSHCGTFNQALMELGALICKPTSPLCRECPLQHTCYAFQHHQTADLPVKIKRTKYRHRYFHYLVILQQSHTYLHHRNNPKDIWYHLYEFPLMETEAPASPEQILASLTTQHPSMGKQITLVQKTPEVVHTLSHQKIHAQFFILQTRHTPSAENHWIKVNINNLDDYPTHVLTQRFLHRHGLSLLPPHKHP